MSDKRPSHLVVSYESETPHQMIKRPRVTPDPDIENRVTWDSEIEKKKCKGIFRPLLPGETVRAGIFPAAVRVKQLTPEDIQGAKANLSKRKEEKATLERQKLNELFQARVANGDVVTTH